MKLNFTKTMLATAMLLGLGSRAMAADLIVEENGVLPNYATIQAAVNAASSSVVDRIFVKNKAGNSPYQENVTISKSVTILPYDPDGVFYCFGNYTINPISGGGEVTIIGMYNNSGSINSFANTVNLTVPTRVNVLGSTLLSGGINTGNSGFVSHIAGNSINGSVTTRTATITGNLVDGSITINDVGGSVTGYPEDTLYIVGNRLTTTAGGVGAGYILWNNDDDYFMIANNNIRHSTYGIFTQLYKAGAGVNKIENNSIRKNGNINGAHGISITGTVPANTNLKIINNSIFDENTSNSFTEFAIQFSATPASPSFVSMEYNVHRSWTNGLTNVSNTVVSMIGNVAGGASYTHDATTGDCAAPECINLGSPATDYTDLDLTRNNVGTGGGSYNFNNFWPNQSGGARVYLVKTPRTVVQSSTINAKADSFDR